MLDLRAREAWWEESRMKGAGHGGRGWVCGRRRSRTRGLIRWRCEFGGGSFSGRLDTVSKLVVLAGGRGMETYPCAHTRSGN
jgi:hypothetical protein